MSPQDEMFTWLELHSCSGQELVKAFDSSGFDKGQR